jgi:hypothetical protein
VLAARIVLEIRAGAGDHQIVAIARISQVGDAHLIILHFAHNRVDVIRPTIGHTYRTRIHQMAAAFLKTAIELGTQFEG